MPSITVNQAEIEVGVQMYLTSLGLNLNDANISMSFTQKRVGGAGLIAEVEINPSQAAKVPVPSVTLAALKEAVIEPVEEAVAEEVAEELVEVPAVTAPTESIFG